jgi:hypothetical protein
MVRDVELLASHPSLVPSRWRRALDIAGDLVLAVALVWALPFALAVAAALIRLAWSVFR